MCHPDGRHIAPHYFGYIGKLHRLDITQMYDLAFALGQAQYYAFYDCYLIAQLFKFDTLPHGFIYIGHQAPSLTLSQPVECHIASRGEHKRLKSRLAQ